MATNLYPDAILDASIEEKKLATDLQEKIAGIDTNATAIATETTAREKADETLTNDITTIKSVLQVLSLPFVEIVDDVEVEEVGVEGEDGDIVFLNSGSGGFATKMFGLRVTSPSLTEGTKYYNAWSGTTFTQYNVDGADGKTLFYNKGDGGFYTYDGTDLTKLA